MSNTKLVTVDSFSSLTSDKLRVDSGIQVLDKDNKLLINILRHNLYANEIFHNERER